MTKFIDQQKSTDTNNQNENMEDQWVDIQD